MRAQRPVLATIAVAASALAGAGAAWPASPQKIYKDLADNGRLDGRYSRADVARAFNLDRVIRTDRPTPARPRPARATPVAPTRQAGRRVPFTGLDLALLTVVGGPLLLIGVLVRRRVTPAAAEPEVARG